MLTLKPINNARWLTAGVVNRLLSHTRCACLISAARYLNGCEKYESKCVDVTSLFRKSVNNLN